MKTLLLLIILAFGIAGQIFSQISAKNFTTYDIHSGLSQSTVQTIFQDSRYFMWFGTQDGLNKFDGTKFTVIKPEGEGPNSLSENWISNILMEDSRGYIWLYTSDATLNRFDPKTNQFFNYQGYADKNNKLIDFNRLNSIVEDEHQNLWFKCKSGIYQIDHKTNKITNYTTKLSKDFDPKIHFILKCEKDKSGNIWVLTSNGLYRYNNKSGKFDCFQKYENDNLRLLSNTIYAIYEDKMNHFWVIHSKGISKKDARTDFFQNYRFPVDTLNLKNFVVRTIISDLEGNLWLGTNFGVFRFDIKTGKIIHYQHNKNIDNSIADNFINIIYVDKKGNILIGTSKGLDIYNPNNENFSHFSVHKKTTLQKNITGIYQDKAGEIWINDRIDFNVGGNLFLADIQTLQLMEIIPDASNPYSLKSANVFRPYIDKNGNLWFGTWGAGVAKYTPNIKKFDLFRDNPYLNNTLKGDGVFGFAEDKQGNIWIASYGMGLNKYNPKTKQFRFIESKIKSKNDIADISVISMATDFEGNIWCGTNQSGIFKVDPITDKITHYQSVAISKSQLVSNGIRCVHVDKQNRLWIAYMNSGFGYMNLKTNIITNFAHNINNTNSLSNNNIWSLSSDRNGNIWISSDGWIDKYNPENGVFTHYKSKGKKGVNASKVLCITEDSKGNLWFGTSGGGLSALSLQNQTFRNWNIQEGLPNSVIYGIVEDDKGKLWLSTNNGISQFDPKTNFFTNYDISNGLQSNEFNMFAFLKDHTGKIYFGGISGFNAFYPENIQKDTISPVSIITGMQIFGKEVHALTLDKLQLFEPNSPNKIIQDGSKYYTYQNISYQKEIEISHDEKIFTIEYSSVNFNNSDKNKFRYKLENFDKDWNEAGTRKFAIYTNLAPGPYIFKVISANSDGVWNKTPAELKIIVKPPFWKTWWFITLEIITFILILAIYIKKRESRLLFHKNVLERKVEERTHQLNEMNEELKLRNELILQQKEEIIQQALQLQTDLVAQNHASELALLRSQINPHFLFNTLNNIYALVYQKSEIAPEAVMKLSEIMRYMLYDSSFDKVLLSKEVSYLQSFIELQKLRLRDKDFIEFNIKGNINGLLFPPMLLVPFVENAFKHGTKQMKSPGIEIDLTIENYSLKFIVENYFKMDNSNKDSIGGIGMKNVKRRLELLFKDRHELLITQTADKFIVKLEINIQ